MAETVFPIAVEFNEKLKASLTKEEEALMNFLGAVERLDEQAGCELIVHGRVFKNGD